MPEQASVPVRCGNVAKSVRVIQRRMFGWGPVVVIPDENQVTLTGDLRSVRSAVRELRGAGLIGKKAFDDAIFYMDFWHEPRNHLPLNAHVSAEENERLRELLPLVEAYARTVSAPDSVLELTGIVRGVMTRATIPGL